MYSRYIDVLCATNNNILTWKLGGVSEASRQDSPLPPPSHGQPPAPLRPPPPPCRLLPPPLLVPPAAPFWSQVATPPPGRHHARLSSPGVKGSRTAGQRVAGGWAAFIIVLLLITYVFHSAIIRKTSSFCACLCGCPPCDGEEGDTGARQCSSGNVVN